MAWSEATWTTATLCYHTKGQILVDLKEFKMSMLYYVQTKQIQSGYTIFTCGSAVLQ